MAIRRWVQLATFLILIFVTRNADAIVVGVCNQTNCTGAKTAAVGNVVVKSTSATNSDIYLTSDIQNYDADLVISGCSSTNGGTGTFTARIGGVSTGIQLKNNSNNVVDVTYTPDTRGNRTCTVNVYPAGTTTGSLGSFTLTANGVAPVVSSTASISFATPIRHADSAAIHDATANLTITNTSTDTGQTLTISNVTSDNADYTITPPSQTTLNPGGTGSSGIWVVTFNPSVLGSDNATLTITSNDPLNPTRTVPVTGTGGSATISVTPTINFNVVDQGTTSTTQNIVVSNTATSATRGNLNVTNATLMNNSAGWFKFPGCANSTTSCAQSMNLTSATGNIGVVCNPPPNATGSQTASVVVTSDADVATANSATLNCTAGRADIVVTTTPLAFSDQLINTSSGGMTVMIQNTGNAPLSYDVSLAGTNPGQFTLVGFNNCVSNCPIGATSSVMVTVYFSPNLIGDKTAVLRVNPDNDPDTAGPIDVSLSGTCIAPIASYNFTTFNFNNVEIGATSTGQSLILTNTGTAELTVTSASFTANGAHYTVTGTTGTNLSLKVPATTNNTTMWTIACKPTAQGPVNGTFTVTTNSSVAPLTQPITLNCTGMRGNLVIAPTTWDFGQRLEGSSTPQGFTLTNNGNLAVTNINYAMTGTGLGYSVTSPTFPIASLGPGASTPVTVTFAPANGNEGGPKTVTFSGVWGTGNAPTSAPLTLNGDGLTTGYDTNPSNPYPADWGDVRFDTPTPLNVNVINTAGTGYNIMSLTITPDVNTASSELVLVQCRRNGGAAAATANGCPAGTTYAPSSGVNDTVVVTLQCRPNNRVGMIGGTLTVHTSLPINPDRVVALKCNSTTAVLELAPATVVDFGPIDLDVTPTATTKTVTLKNVGAASMGIGTVTKPLTGPFTFTATPTATVVPNGTYSFDVTFTPSGERMPNQPETASVVIPLTGAIGTPGTVTVSLSGYGVDRHIELKPVPTFPNTYKNPGDKAPILPITIANNGDANLNVSAVMLSDYPIWSVENPEMVDVGGRASHDFMVKFSPVTAGKAPTGHMAIMNNDNGRMIVTLDLDGIGLDRQVSFGPAEINLGYVGIGITTRLSDAGLLDPTTSMPVLALNLINSEPVGTEPFALTGMSINGGDGAFRVLDTTDERVISDKENMPLDPQSTHQFDVLFTPPHEGDFVADLNLYLDNAQDPHTTVRLRGRGLYVDVKGGGGCSTGNGSGAGALLLVLGALLLGRRRRGLLGLLGVVGATTAVSAETRNLDVALFEPTPATQVTGLQSSSADVGNDGDFAVTAMLTYGDNLLVLDTPQNAYNAVDTRQVLVLGGAYAFGKRFEAGARMPMYLQSGQATGKQDEMFQVDKINSVSRGDATIHAKMNGGATEMFGGDVSYGGLFALSIPTRSGGEFAGTNMPQARLLGLATLTKGRFTYQVNAGAIIRSKEVYSSYVQRSAATFAVGASYRLADKVWLGGEVFGNLIPGGHIPDTDGMTEPAREWEKPIEALGELTYRMSRTAVLALAVGRGLTDGVGTSNVRGALMFSFTPGAEEIVPLPKKIHVEGPNDKDGDGVKDKLDACANEPEDMDLFEDGDGCPDLDNDNDSITDDKDKCATDAEDRDRFQDDDGCPERDNDNDGVLDEQDKCPVAAEDKDGFQDSDGCADPDNDGDGIVDKADKCPQEAEAINGNADDDGCPDRGDSLVVISPDRLDLLDNVQFDGNGSKISRASKNILGQIGATLRAHPELVRIRLTAHVQPTSNTARDLKLSEERAKAVREWLVDWGIDPLRLQSSGFGGTKPLVDPKSKGAQSINDRFELIILERK